ncbi:MAG: radical SAM family heme chaperone HemW [Pseudomonadota bacterium]
MAARQATAPTAGPATDKHPVWDWRPGGFGLYIHWPFCRAKCPYCDFNSHVRGKIDQARWRAALLQELAHAAAETPGRWLDSIFFGGGTPSLMDSDTVAELIATACRFWHPVADIEITLEANPTSVEAARFRAFAEAGVTRVSVGIQALRDDDLHRLGRQHSAAEARRAYDIARNCFARVSFDLIYARQGQTLAAWRQELAEALSMGADHLSLYQLTIEPGTAFAARLSAGGLRGLPTPDLGADLFEATQEMCGAASMPAYEVSNHARPDQESRHNLVYWRQGDWVGIGPGAHGRVTRDSARHATETHHDPETWLHGVARDGHAQVHHAAVTAEDQRDEAVLMGLRLTEGLDLTRLRALAAARPDGDHGLNGSALAELRDAGMIWQTDTRLGTTASGRLVLDHIAAALLA